MTKWDEIESDTQDALIDWYNLVDVSAEEREMLAELHLAGNFHHFECAECNTSVHAGQPDDWGQFQGVYQDEYIGELCADCAGVYLRLKEYAHE